MEEMIAKKFLMLKFEWNERQKRLWAASNAHLSRGIVLQKS